MIKVQPGYFHCSLCGFDFEKDGASCHTGCVLAKHCKLVRCPSCGYEFPEPNAPNWLQKLMGKRADSVLVPAPESISLQEASEGITYEMICLNGSHASRRSALAVYGLVPGCRLSLTQKRPSFIIQVGETELAFEGSIAREIFVRPVVA